MYVRPHYVFITLALPLGAYQYGDAQVRCFGCATLLAWESRQPEWPEQPATLPAYDLEPAVLLSIQTTQMPPPPPNQTVITTPALLTLTVNDVIVTTSA